MNDNSSSKMRNKCKWTQNESFEVSVYSVYRLCNMISERAPSPQRLKQSLIPYDGRLKYLHHSCLFIYGSQSSDDIINVYALSRRSYRNHYDISEYHLKSYHADNVFSRSTFSKCVVFGNYVGMALCLLIRNNYLGLHLWTNKNCGWITPLNTI